MQPATAVETPSRVPPPRLGFKRWCKRVGLLMAIIGVGGMIKVGSAVGGLIVAIVVLFVAIEITAVVATVRLVRGRGVAADVAWPLVAVALLAGRELPPGYRLTLSLPFGPTAIGWSMSQHSTSPTPPRFTCQLDVEPGAIADAMRATAGCHAVTSPDVSLHVRVELDSDELCFVPLYTRVSVQARLHITGTKAVWSKTAIAIDAYRSATVAGVYACATLREDVGRALGEQIAPAIAGAAAVTEEGSRNPPSP